MDIKQRIKSIQDNPAYTPEQKNQMLMGVLSEVGDLTPQEPSPVPVPPSNYQRQSEPVQLDKTDVELINAVEQGIAEQAKSDDWKNRDYNTVYRPTFAAVEAERTRFPIGGGKQVTIRRLKSGDFELLAALIPRWKYHLLGDMPINPILGGVEPFKLLFLLIEKAFSDWYFENGDLARSRPTDFALSVWSTLKFFTKEGIENPDSIQINDFLDADLDQLHDLAAGVYRGNVNFFKKAYSRLGPIANLISTITGIYSNAIGTLQSAAEDLSEKSQKESDNLKKSSKESEPSLTLKKGRKNRAG